MVCTCASICACVVPTGTWWLNISSTTRPARLPETEHGIELRVPPGRGCVSQDDDLFCHCASRLLTLRGIWLLPLLLLRP